MKMTARDIADLKRLYKEVLGLEIGDERAVEAGQKILALVAAARSSEPDRNHTDHGKKQTRRDAAPTNRRRPADRDPRADD